MSSSILIYINNHYEIKLVETLLLPTSVCVPTEADLVTVADRLTAADWQTV